MAALPGSDLIPGGGISTSAAALAAGGAGVAVALDIVQAIFAPPRYFSLEDGSAIKADVTIEEDHHDEMVVTEHPVDQNAAITDHCYKMPARVVLKAGWSDSHIFAPRGISKTTYHKLLDLQESRKVFTLYTGKRQYDNMVIKSLAVRTDVKFENALMATIVCQQIVLVGFNAAQIASVTPDQALLQDPPSDTPSTNTGVKTATNVTDRVTIGVPP